MTTQSRRLEGHQSKREPEQRPAHVVVGAPHGFGVWIDGEFHRVDIGELTRQGSTRAVELRAGNRSLIIRNYS